MTISAISSVRGLHWSYPVKYFKRRGFNDSMRRELIFIKELVRSVYKNTVARELIGYRVPTRELLDYRKYQGQSRLATECVNKRADWP